jgi:hypothetical protein
LRALKAKLEMQAQPDLKEFKVSRVSREFKA